jgi:Family of unknown function (DUF695)
MQTKLITFFMASFLSTLFGCSGQTNKADKKEQIFPDEEFSVVEAKMVDGKPTVGSINQAYKSYNKKIKYPWCLKLAIGLELDSCYENGLPKGDESKIANKLEDELLVEIKKLATAHYIGHLFNDTFLDVYVYLDEPEKVHQYLQTQINKEGLIRGFGYEINKDPAWTTVREYFK